MESGFQLHLFPISDDRNGDHITGIVLSQQFHPPTNVFDGIFIPSHQEVTGLNPRFFSGSAFGNTTDQDAR